MIIRKIRMENFRGFRDKTIEFNDKSVVLLSAANGIGKTTTIDAIEWCLTGDVGRLKTAFDTRSTNDADRKMNTEGILKHRDAEENAKVRVIVWLFDGEKEIILCREQKKDELNPSSSKVTIDGNEATAKIFIQEYVGDSFYNFHFCDVQKSFNIQSKKRKDLNALFGEFITNYDEQKQIAENLDVFMEDVDRYIEDKKKQRMSALEKRADIYIINRENVQWLVEKSGKKFDYDMVVVDELSSFKNHEAKRFRAFMKVRPKVKRIVGLTGTPSSNGLMDLFAEFKLLDMGERLGRFIGAYRANFFRPDKMNGPIVYSYKPIPGAESMIYNRISDITISMKATDYLKMPELVSSRYEVQMDDAEKQKYEEFKKDLVLEIEDGEITAANAASLSGKLSQMANGAVYSDNL